MQTNTGQFNAVGRILLAAIFLLSGIGKISGYAATQGYMEYAGVPGALLPLVILFEIVAAIAAIVGFKVRVAALALAVFSMLTALLLDNRKLQSQVPA